MNTKQALVIAVSVLAGALARDVLVGRAGASEDALRRDDVVSIVRALEHQVQATERQVDATKELGRAVNDVGRSCR